jgi:RNA polymerase sigma factor (sigma-70 family)
MDFQELFNKISPKLKRVAYNHKIYRLSVDRDDLYQEMSIHLWNNFKDGFPKDVNEGYIIKGCLFHILNYLRKQKENVSLLSLEQPINEGGDTLRDILPNNKESSDEYIDRYIAIEDIKNNGFTKREKEVFSLMLQRYTVREIGRILGISHVRVINIKNGLVKKYQKKNKIRVVRHAHHSSNHPE